MRTLARRVVTLGNFGADEDDVQYGAMGNQGHYHRPGLLYVAGVLVRGEFAVPSASTATRFASITTAPTYSIAYMLIIAATALVFSDTLLSVP